MKNSDSFNKTGSIFGFIRRDVFGKTKARSFWSKFPPYFVFFFGLLSFVGTYLGLRDIIVQSGEFRGGILGEGVIFLLVALATLAMIYFLRVTLSKGVNIFNRLVSFFLYTITAAISVTFGFAFYWAQIEAPRQSISGAFDSIQLIESEITLVSYSLEQVINEQKELAEYFLATSEKERLSGGTCGDKSPPGKGPRRAHRSRMAQEVKFSVEKVEAWLQEINIDVASIKAIMSTLQSVLNSSGEDISSQNRIKLLNEIKVKIRSAGVKVQDVANKTDYVSNNFREWATYYDGTKELKEAGHEKTFFCNDVTAISKLGFSINSLDSIKTLKIPNLPNYAGPTATREAVDRMISSFKKLLTFKSDASKSAAEEFAEALNRDQTALRIAVKKESRTPLQNQRTYLVENESSGLRNSDMFSLYTAAIIDLLLFGFSLLNRPKIHVNNFPIEDEIFNDATIDFNPLDLFGDTAQIDTDSPLRRWNKYTIDLRGDKFMIVPLNDGDDDNSFYLKHLMIVYQKHNFATESSMKDKVIRKQLKAQGKNELLACEGELKAYRLSEAYNRYIANAILRNQGFEAPDDDLDLTS